MRVATNAARGPVATTPVRCTSRVGSTSNPHRCWTRDSGPDTRLSSDPFEFHGVSVDFGELAPRMAELSHGHLPEPDPNPETIPAEEPFGHHRPGVFASHFPVGGAVIAS